MKTAFHLSSYVCFMTHTNDRQTGSAATRARAALGALPGGLKLRLRSSARSIRMHRDRRGVLHTVIDNAPLRGVTPAMFRWWIENLAGVTTWNGSDFSGPEVPRYVLWHHLDHTAVIQQDPPVPEGTGGFAEGVTTLVRETINQTGRRLESTVVTERLDDREWNFRLLVGPLTVAHVRHHFGPDTESDGTGDADPAEAPMSFHVHSAIGVTLPVFGPLINWLIVPFFFNRRDAERWVIHSIEETGQSEKVIPPLYNHEHRSN